MASRPEARARGAPGRRLLGPLALLVLLGAGSCRRDPLERGRRALEEHALQEAERAFRAALRRAPSDPEALYGLGWTYHLAGRDDEARVFFERCERLHPESPLGAKGLGSVAMAEGNLQVAEHWFQEALARAPGDRAIRNSLALLYLKEQRYDEALAILRELLAEQPESAELRLGYVEALLRSGRPEEARREVDAALERRMPDGRRALFLVLRARALLALSSGRLDPSRCAETAPPLLAWLEAAEADLDRAEALGGGREVLAVRRLLLRRRAAITRSCPLSELEGG